MLSPSTTDSAIGALFRAALQGHPDTCFLRSPAAAPSYAECYQRCWSLARHLNQLPGQRLASFEVDSPSRVLLLLACALSNKSLVLFNADHSADQVREQAEALAVDLLVTDSENLLQDAQVQEASGRTELPGDTHPESELLIFSSGTTGSPKCVRYQWRDLVAQIPKSDSLHPQVWLLAYRLNHFAGIQMLFHTLVNGHTLVLPDSSEVGAALQAVQDFGVTHISSTPTFWRFALAVLAPGPLPLRQITLGSEAVTAGLLDALQQRFPQARIVHIYATTELGSCVSVSDGQPGLPVSVLARPAHAPVQFRIVDEELQVKARHGMRSYLGPAADAAGTLADGWRATGDLVEITGERILFRGRRSEIINVGGVKVHPQEVEAVANGVEGVKLVRAYGRDNPVVGQIVALDVLRMEGFTEQDTEERIFAACLQLPRHSRPRQVNFVDSLNTNNYKLERQ